MSTSFRYRVHHNNQSENERTVTAGAELELSPSATAEPSVVSNHGDRSDYSGSTLPCATEETNPKVAHLNPTAAERECNVDHQCSAAEPYDTHQPRIDSDGYADPLEIMGEANLYEVPVDNVRPLPDIPRREQGPATQRKRYFNIGTAV